MKLTLEFANMNLFSQLWFTVWLENKKLIDELAAILCPALKWRLTKPLWHCKIGQIWAKIGLYRAKVSPQMFLQRFNSAFPIRSQQRHKEGLSVTTTRTHIDTHSQRTELYSLFSCTMARVAASILLFKTSFNLLIRLSTKRHRRWGDRLQESEGFSPSSCHSLCQKHWKRLGQTQTQQAEQVQKMTNQKENSQVKYQERVKTEDQFI